MCSSPNISMSQPVQRQAAQTPVFRDGARQMPRGRRGTILTGAQGVQDTQVTQKKSLLGQ